MPRKKKHPHPGDPDFRIVKAHQENFKTLLKAVKNGDIALVDCIETIHCDNCDCNHKEHVAVLTAMSTAPDGTVTMTPLARFFNGNPYEILTPPE
jgi:hypothetical protein